MPNNVLWVVLGLCLVAAAVVAARRLVTVLLTLRARALTPTVLRLLSRRVRTRDASRYGRPYDRAFFERVHRGFKAIAAAEPKRVRVIDATQDIGAVEAQIWSLVTPLVAR